MILDYIIILYNIICIVARRAGTRNFRFETQHRNFFEETPQEVSHHFKPPCLPVTFPNYPRYSQVSISITPISVIILYMLRKLYSHAKTQFVRLVSVMC